MIGDFWWEEDFIKLCGFRDKSMKICSSREYELIWYQCYRQQYSIAYSFRRLYHTTPHQTTTRHINNKTTTKHTTQTTKQLIKIMLLWVLLLVLVLLVLVLLVINNHHFIPTNKIDANENDDFFKMIITLDIFFTDNILIQIKQI